jgi:hypothetical protein
MTQSEKSNQQSTTQAESLLTNSDKLIQEAVSTYNLQNFSPVEMAFPNIISDQQVNTQGDFAMNVQELFAQQAQLFNPSAQPIPQTSTVMQETPDTEGDSQELQAIRAMFDAN